LHQPGTSILRVPLAVSPTHAAGTTLEPAAATAAAWHEFGSRLRAFIARRVPADAIDDVLQQVFLKLHRSLDGPRPIGHVHGWLHRTARHAIADHYRAPARREQPVGDAQDVADLGATNAAGAASPEAEFEQLARCLRPLLDRLPPASRQVLLDVELAGVRQREAALSAGVSLSGMKSRIQRARRQLEALLLECCPLTSDSSQTGAPPLAVHCDEGAGIAPCDSGCAPPPPAKPATARRPHET
jgi:RNA polymerase sigma-70 factor (ECF subfamily)